MSVINVKKHTTLEVETPQLNRTSIYIKTDNSLAWKDDTGTEHVAATGTDNPATTQVSNNNVITAASASDILVTGMTLTPPAGTYLAFFSCTWEGGNNNTKMFLSLYGGGAAVASSFRASVSRFQAGLNTAQQNVISVSTQAEVTVNGSQAIEARWRGDGSTLTMYDKSLNIIRIR